MRYQKYYTVKEWKRFNKIVERENGNDITAQELLCKKYDVILTDYKINPLVKYKDLSKKELTVKILKNFNMKNFDKGMKVFDQGLKGFTDSIDAVTSQLDTGQTSSNQSQNKVKIWSDKKPSRKSSIKIWSDPPKKKKNKKRKPVQDKHKRNLQAIWGKK